MMYLAVLVALTFLSTSSAWDYTDVGSVAFSAAVTPWVSVPANHIVVYDSIFTNRGYGYNNITGVFTAPKGGLYVFHVHGLSQIGKELYTGLFKNNVGILSVYENQVDNYDNGGNTVILEINEGDIVYVKAIRDSYLYGGADKYNTFSGYLIGAAF